MNTRRTLTATNVALALALIALKPALNADPVVENARDQAAASEVYASERKLALAEIDAQIAAIEHSLHQAPDAATKDAARIRLDELKKRRTDLRKNYVSAKAAELRADANLEYRKAVAWTKGTISDVKDTVTGTKPTTSDTVAATTNPEAGGAAARLALYKLNPSPDNKAEVKAALEALDDEIDRLEDHADDMPKGPERDALRKRVEALEARKDALESDFSRARWNAVVADLKSEWDRIAP
jgi:hypothetical protein